jgi:hypothetical protein
VLKVPLVLMELMELKELKVFRVLKEQQVLKEH